jgi:hypothetical protein
MNSRRQILKSAFGAVALAGGVPNGIAQTSQPRRDPRTGAATPDFAMLSNAVLNSYGLAAGNVWTRNNTGIVKSDDLVRASSLLRVTNAHLDEIELNTYIDAQISQHQNELLSGITISPDFVHAVSKQLQSYGVLLSDAQINSMYPVDVNARQQALLDVTMLGVRGVRNQLADSIDLAAKKLRLLEIATACGALLDQLPSSLALSMQADAQRQASGTTCQVTGNAINQIGIIFGVFVLVALLACAALSGGTCYIAATYLAAILGVDLSVLQYINGVNCG